MSFVEEVRASKIRQPTQRRFDLTCWDDAYSKHRAGPQDDFLWITGHYIFEELELIRAKLEILPSLPSNRKASLLSSAINREYKTGIGLLHSVQPPEDVVFMNDLVERPHMAGPLGNPVWPTAHIEGLVDAFRFPYAAGGPRRGKVRLQDLARTLQLATNYSIAEDMWRDALWSDWRVDHLGCLTFFQSSQPEFEADLAVARHRLEMLLQEHVAYAVATWRTKSDGLNRSLLQKQIRLATVDASGIPLLRGLRGQELGHTLPPAFYLSAAAMEELYWNELLVTPLPRLADLTVRDLIACWTVVAAIAEHFVSEFSGNTSAMSTGDLVRGFRSRVSRAGLRQALVNHCNLSESKAETAISSFVLPQNVRVDPWVYPLLPLGDSGFLEVVVPVAHSSNLIRVIEHWIGQGGLSLSDRGDLFERFAREELGAFRPRCHNQDSFWTFGKAAQFNGEEIDAVAILGGTLLLLECKCTVFPSGSMAYARVRDLLADAQTQVQRKREVVESKMQEFVSYLRNNGYQGDEPSKVVAFVCSNLPHSPALAFGADTPVTDLILLRRYLESGQSRFGVTLKDGEPQGEAARLLYYRNTSQCEANLLSFLRRPPVLDAYRRSVRLGSVRLPTLGHGWILCQRFAVEPREAWPTSTRAVLEEWSARRGASVEYAVP